MESFVANCKFPIGGGGGFTLLVVRYIAIIRTMYCY